MKINRTPHGDSAEIVVFTKKMFILQKMALARLWPDIIYCRLLWVMTQAIPPVGITKQQIKKAYYMLLLENTTQLLFRCVKYIQSLFCVSTCICIRLYLDSLQKESFFSSKFMRFTVESLFDLGLRQVLCSLQNFLIRRVICLRLRHNKSKCFSLYPFRILLCQLSHGHFQHGMIREM